MRFITAKGFLFAMLWSGFVFANTDACKNSSPPPSKATEGKSLPPPPKEVFCTSSLECEPPRKHFCNTGPYFLAEYLLWQATEQNLNYATNQQYFLPEARIFNAKFNWQSGCRLGVGYNMEHDQWDTNIAWTWFEDKASGHANGTATQMLNGVNVAIDVSSLNAKSNSNLHLNLLDWELGREFYLSKWSSLRPFAGVRTGWIHQNWVTDLFNDCTVDLVPITGEPILAVDAYIMDSRQKFWGIGLRSGLDTEWDLIGNLSLYANGAISLLYGFFEDRRVEYWVSSGTTINAFDVIGNESCEQAITEIQLGLRWDQMFANDQCRFRIQAGWDHMLFFDYNNTLYSLATVDAYNVYGGNLGFQGLSASMRLDF